MPRYLIACVVLLSAGAVQAATVAVNWSGDYVTAYTNSNTAWLNSGVTDTGSDFGGTAATDWRRSVALNESTAAQPGSGYTHGTSWQYYSAYNIIKYDTSTAPTYYFGVFNRAAAPTVDELEAMYVAANKAAVLTLWEKADFLNGANSTPNLTLASDCTLQMTVALNANMTGRLVVKDGSNFYISNSSIGTVLDGVYTNLTISDPTAQTWATFNPYNGDNMLTDIGGSFTTHAFTDVQAVGFYAAGTISSLAALDFRPSAVTFNVSAVPEPATLGLLALGGLALAGRARRRRRAA